MRRGRVARPTVKHGDRLAKIIQVVPALAAAGATHHLQPTGPAGHTATQKIFILGNVAPSLPILGKPRLRLSWPKRHIRCTSALSRFAVRRETGCWCPVDGCDPDSAACPMLVMAHSARDTRGFSPSCLPRAELFSVRISQNPGGCGYSARPRGGLAPEQSQRPPTLASRCRRMHLSARAYRREVRLARARRPSGPRPSRSIASPTRRAGACA